MIVRLISLHWQYLNQHEPQLPDIWRLFMSEVVNGWSHYATLAQLAQAWLVQLKSPCCDQVAPSRLIWSVDGRRATSSCSRFSNYRRISQNASHAGASGTRRNLMWTENDVAYNNREECSHFRANVFNDIEYLPSFPFFISRKFIHSSRSVQLGSWIGTGSFANWGRCWDLSLPAV